MNMAHVRTIGCRLRRRGGIRIVRRDPVRAHGTDGVLYRITARTDSQNGHAVERMCGPFQGYMVQSASFRIGVKETMTRIVIVTYLQVDEVTRPIIFPTPNFQIPPNLVVKPQPIDIAEIILSRIRRPNAVPTLCRNRISRFEQLSTSETHWSTTKSNGMWAFPILARQHHAHLVADLLPCGVWKHHDASPCLSAQCPDAWEIG
jgi:hypothetical protein